MKQLSAFFVMLIIAVTANAQSKVFKEVSEDISSDMKIITQDDALVGYLVFTQLEKASADSFNYKLTLMDENLNDIGVVNFKEQNLTLEAVSFEQDVLCLAYLKSNIIGKVFKSKREYNDFDAKNVLFTQFLTLAGKIIKTNTTPLNITVPDYASGRRGNFTYSGSLTQPVQLKNFPQKGFACFFGDRNGCNLIGYDLTGKELWKNSISNQKGFSLLTSKADVYLLEKRTAALMEGGYSLLSYSSEGKPYDPIDLNDRDGNSLKVLGFGNDPVSGNPFVSGNIIDPRKGNALFTGKDLAKSPYSGVFAIDIAGHNKKDLKQTFTYWKDGSQKPTISKHGYIYDAKSYSMLSGSYRDFNGNTYFVGSKFTKKPKIAAIVATVVTIPLILPPMMILGAAGTTKCKVTDAALLKLDSKGLLSYENEIPCANSKNVRGAFSLLEYFNQRSFYSISNSDTKSNYIITDDSKNIMIYNVTQKKLVRTVPHKDGRIRTYIFPAKEGHIMVVENNKKEKYTPLSIEALN